MGTAAVIGGGRAGALAARMLKRLVGGRHGVVLIEEEARVYSRSVFPPLAAGLLDVQHLTARDTASLGREGIRVVVEEALRIDPGARRITTANHEIGYDLLLAAPGAETDRSAPAGMAEAGIEIDSLAGAGEIRERLGSFAGDEVAVIIASAEVKYPAAPYEYAFLLDERFRRSGRGRDVAISIYTPEPAPLHVFGPRVSEAVAELLLKRHIRIHLNSQVKLVDPANKSIQLEHGAFPFDLLLYSPAAVPPALLGKSGLAAESGWMDVDPHTLHAGKEGIFGMGDAARVVTPAGETLPKMGSVAGMQAKVAAANAAGYLQNGKVEHIYDGRVGAVIETGRGVLPISGNYYGGSANLRPLPLSRIWGPARKLFTGPG